MFFCNSEDLGLVQLLRWISWLLCLCCHCFSCCLSSLGLLCGPLDSVLLGSLARASYSVVQETVYICLCFCIEWGPALPWQSRVIGVTHFPGFLFQQLSIYWYLCQSCFQVLTHTDSAFFGLWSSITSRVLISTVPQFFSFISGFGFDSSICMGCQLVVSWVNSFP